MRAVYDTLNKKQKELYGESFDEFILSRQSSFANMVEYGKINIDSLITIRV